MELPNHRGLEEKLGKLRSCPGPLVWPLPTPPCTQVQPLSPVKILVTKNTEGTERKHPETGKQKDKGRNLGENRGGGNIDKRY